MNIDIYQKASATTVMPSIENNIEYFALGLASEAGEIAGLISKSLRDTDGDFNSDTLVKELGDVLWFVAQIASFAGTSLSTVAEMNLAKLASRKQRGVLSGSGDNR
jgi:NTP pyrophosphatase (non-canonical NTP hydrolase)